jgi:hypothetical protein
MVEVVAAVATITQATTVPAMPVTPDQAHKQTAVVA